MDFLLFGARDGIDAALEIKRRCDDPIIFVIANNDPGTHARQLS
jgi:hypothetical protein